MNMLLETAFAFIACDGEIVQDEIDMLRKMAAEGLFGEQDIDQQVNALVAKLQAEGNAFMRGYLDRVGSLQLSGEDELKLLNVAVQTIFADDLVKYSEVKFFRMLRNRLKAVDNATILEALPQIDDFWLEEDIKKSSETIENEYFSNIDLKDVKLEQINKNN